MVKNSINPNRSSILNNHLGVGFSWGGPLTRVIPENHQPNSYITPTASFPKNSDQFWMSEALCTSLNSIGITRPNPAVGCIILNQNGQEIARGATQAYRHKHAEAMAFQKLQDPSQLTNGTLYTTLEPCTHQGHQPPCLDLILKSPLKRIVIARRDPNPLIQGGIEKLLAAGKKVLIGPLSAEATAWNFAFIVKTQMQLARPVFGLKWAQTLDGQLVDDEGHSQWITSPTARSYTHWLRQKYDALLIGVQTLLKDNPSLDARDCILPHQADPKIIIWDPKGLCFQLSAAQQTKLLTQTFRPEKTILILTNSSHTQSANNNWMQSHPHIHAHGLPGINWPSEIATFLEDQGEKVFGNAIQSVLIEGGPATLQQFITTDLADVLHIMTAPKLTGGRLGRIHLHRTLKQAYKYEPLSVAQLGPDTLTEMIPPRLNSIW